MLHHNDQSSHAQAERDFGHIDAAEFIGNPTPISDAEAADQAADARLAEQLQADIEQYYDATRCRDCGKPTAGRTLGGEPLRLCDACTVLATISWALTPRFTA